MTVIVSGLLRCAPTGIGGTVSTPARRGDRTIDQDMLRLTWPFTM